MSIESFAQIASSQIPSSLVDVIGVYESSPSFQQVFPGARPMKVEVNEGLKPMEHPLESGAEATDHVVFLPTDITLYMFLRPLEFKSTYLTIQQLHQSATKLTVKTRTGVYPDYIIQTMPHTETADVYNSVTMVIKMHQVMVATTEVRPVPRNPSNSSTVNRGTVNGNTPVAEKERESSILFRKTRKRT